MMNKNESDLELALFLARHIDSPCEVDVEGQAYNIRDFYSMETGDKSKGELFQSSGQN